MYVCRARTWCNEEVFFPFLDGFFPHVLAWVRGHGLPSSVSGRPLRTPAGALHGRRYGAAIRAIQRGRRAQARALAAPRGHRTAARGPGMAPPAASSALGVGSQGRQAEAGAAPVSCGRGARGGGGSGTFPARPRTCACASAEPVGCRASVAPPARLCQRQAVPRVGGAAGTPLSAPPPVAAAPCAGSHLPSPRHNDATLQTALCAAFGGCACVVVATLLWC